MSIYSEVRTLITTGLSGVANIGRVQGYERFANQSADFLNFYKTTISSVDQVRAWVVTLDGISPVTWATMRTESERTYTFAVRGYLGLDDATATEQTFYDLVEAVLNELDGIDLSSVTGVTHIYSQPGEVRLAEPRTLAGVLCHYAEIILPVVAARAVS